MVQLVAAIADAEEDESTFVGEGYTEAAAELEEETVDERPTSVVELEADAEVIGGLLPEELAACPTASVMIGSEARTAERVYFMMDVSGLFFNECQGLPECNDD